MINAILKVNLTLVLIKTLIKVGVILAAIWLFTGRENISETAQKINDMVKKSVEYVK